MTNKEVKLPGVIINQRDVAHPILFRAEDPRNKLTVAAISENVLIDEDWQVKPTSGVTPKVLTPDEKKPYRLVFNDEPKPYYYNEVAGAVDHIERRFGITTHLIKAA